MFPLVMTTEATVIPSSYLIGFEKCSYVVEGVFKHPAKQPDLRIY